MDPDLHRRVQATISELRANPDPRSAGTESTYASKLKANWQPYARGRGLPTTFDPTTSPLTTQQIMDFIVASKLGMTRRHSRDGAQRAQREGEPLAKSTLEGVLAALRHAHVRMGLSWAGDHPRVKDARRGYAATSNQVVTKAAPLTADHLNDLFRTTPTRDSSSDARPRARAVAAALGVPFAALLALDARCVQFGASSATVALGGLGRRTAVCLLSRVDDPIASAACAHCQLRAWAATNPLGAIIEASELGSLRAGARRLESDAPMAAPASVRTPTIRP